MYDLEPRWMAQRLERELALGRARRRIAMGPVPAGTGAVHRWWSALLARLRATPAVRPVTAATDDAVRPAAGA